MSNPSESGESEEPLENEGSSSELLKTGDVLSESGISRQVLYRYIQMELIEPGQVTATGRHLFRPSVFRQIKRIQQLNDSGYTLRDIREIFGQRIRKM